MLRKLLLPTVLGLIVGASGAWVGACAADGSGADSGSGGGATGGAGTGRNDASIDVAPDGQEPPGPVSYADLCGEGDCIPGDTIPCEPPSSGSTGATGGSTSTGTGGSGGGGGGAGGGGVIAYGCQVDVSGNEPASVCAPVNPSVELGGACDTASGCPEGAGCAGKQTVGQCLAYCCDDLDCPTAYFCLPVAAWEDGRPTGTKIPVCKQGNNCSLFSAVEQCPDGETCTIVKSDGTTGCTPTGTGQACDPCPCAPGHMCNYSTGLCQRLCKTGPQGSNVCTGAGGTCQGILPDIGVCIGGNASCDD